jgi:nicotinamidase-related amidase
MGWQGSERDGETEPWSERGGETEPQTKRGGRTVTTETPTSDSVIGLVATRDNAEALVRSILRAHRRGFGVLVTYDGPETMESVSFARQLGVRVVDPAIPDPDIDTLHRELTATARAMGYSTIVRQMPACPRIDYEATGSRRADESVAVEAVPETSAEPAVLVGIPAFNEVATIASVVETAREYADQVLVVSDGSADGTAMRAREAGATVIEHERNRGYGAALQTLFTAAADRGTDYLVVLDGDGQHATEEIPTLVDAQRDADAEIVIGNRFHDGARGEIPLYRRIGIATINALTNLSLGSISSHERLSDTQSGFRAYDLRAITSLAAADLGDGMDASTDILYHASDRGYTVEEVEPSITYDVEDANSHHPVRHGLTLVHSVLTTIERRHPVLLLGVPGVASVGLGLAIGLWALQANLPDGGLVYAFISMAFFLAGVLSCFTAIILHALQRSR